VHFAGSGGKGGGRLWGTYTSGSAPCFLDAAQKRLITLASPYSVCFYHQPNDTKRHERRSHGTFLGSLKSIPFC